MFFCVEVADVGGKSGELCTRKTPCWFYSSIFSLSPLSFLAITRWLITYDEWKYDGIVADVNGNYNEGDHDQDHMKTKRMMARIVRPSFVGRTALLSDLVRKEGMEWADWCLWRFCWNLGRRWRPMKSWSPPCLQASVKCCRQRRPNRRPPRPHHHPAVFLPCFYLDFSTYLHDE